MSKSQCLELQMKMFYNKQFLSWSNLCMFFVIAHRRSPNQPLQHGEFSLLVLCVLSSRPRIHPALLWTSKQLLCRNGVRCGFCITMLYDRFKNLGLLSLFASVVIGQSNYFGSAFTILIWKHQLLRIAIQVNQLTAESLLVFDESWTRAIASK